MKKLLALILCGIIMLSLSGCYEKKIVVPKPIPADSIPGGEGEEAFDWEQVRDDCNDLLNLDEYPHKVYLDFQVDDAAKVVGLALSLDSTSTPDIAEAYATDYIKAFNDAIATQDWDYAASGDDYYGGYFDEYGIELLVFHLGDEEDPDKYIVNQIIEAGSGAPVHAN